MGVVEYLFPSGILIGAAVLLALSRRWRGPQTAFLFFIGTLFPVLGFFNVYPFRYSWVADHFSISRESRHTGTSRVGCKPIAVKIDPVGGAGLAGTEG